MKDNHPTDILSVCFGFKEKKKRTTQYTLIFTQSLCVVSQLQQVYISTELSLQLAPSHQFHSLEALLLLGKPDDCLCSCSAWSPVLLSAPSSLSLSMLSWLLGFNSARKRKETELGAT